MVQGTEILTEILEAALSELEEGIAVLDADSHVLFWSPAAAAITGHLSADLLSRALPGQLYEIDAQHAHPGEAERESRPMLVNLRHRQGHSLPAMLRQTPLRNALGRRFGMLIRFHPVEEIDALPHGARDDDSSHDNRLQESQADMEERLDEAWQEWHADSVPFGLLWINVDQAAMLRKTHGRDASDAMLAIVERTLLHGLKPSEILGRWGDHEFLALCHERTAERLEAHAHHLRGLARTADFRWWGDRVGLTVSIGAAQAMEGETLRGLLLRAQRAMQESVLAGGNHVEVKAYQAHSGR